MTQIKTLIERKTECGILLEVCISDAVPVALGAAQNGSVAIVPVLPADTTLQPEQVRLHHASVVRVPRRVNSEVVICREILKMFSGVHNKTIKDISRHTSHCSFYSSNQSPKLLVKIEPVSL